MSGEWKMDDHVVMALVFVGDAPAEGASIGGKHHVGFLVDKADWEAVCQPYQVSDQLSRETAAAAKATVRIEGKLREALLALSRRPGKAP